MLREVERPDGSKVAFEYDAFARRTKKRLLSAAGEVLRETRYVWDGHVIVHELGSDEDELITWRFEPETFTPVAKEKGERRWAIASDHLGTPTEMVDELGKLAWKMQLDVLGVPAFEEGDAAHCPFRWPGQYEDEETGLYYNRFRYYDPEQGGYTADDPIGLEGGIRLRGYVEDPWTWVDPWGLSGCSSVEGGTGTASEKLSQYAGPTRGQTVYRVYGGDARPDGASWTPEKPAGNYRARAGLPSGGASGAVNSGRFVIEGRLEDPSAVVLVRKALSLDGNSGGAPEYIIPRGIERGVISLQRISGVNPEF